MNILTYLILFSSTLLSTLLLKLVQTKQINKMFTNYTNTTRKRRAARIVELDEVRARFDEASAKVGNLNENLSRIEKFFEASAQNSVEH